MNLQIVSHVPTHFICFPGNIAIGPFENTLRGRDSPSLDRRVLHKAEVGMTDNIRIAFALPCIFPLYFDLSSFQVTFLDHPGPGPNWIKVETIESCSSN